MILALDQQVAPLALCRRLRELGAPQESLYSWRLADAPDIVAAAIFVGPLPVDDVPGRLEFVDGVPDFCAAYMVAELAAMLPGSIPCPNTGVRSGDAIVAGGPESEYVFSSGKGAAGRWWTGMICENGVENESGMPLVLHMVAGRETEAEARAALLIALVESGVVKFQAPGT